MYRIFLFGESAALGDPRPAYGVGRYLETLLRQRFPDVRFEVVCVAMTAINSHAILPLARECAGYEGDLWIIYMGNNEFYGPFGAGTVFGSQAPPNCLVRGYLALQQTRIGQGLVWVARRWAGSHSPKSWGGLKMFLDQQLAPTDPRKQRVYDNFRKNLEDIVQAGRNSGTPILLSSIAVNLKDCAPLASWHSPPLNSSQAEAWQSVYQAGLSNAAHGACNQALTNFQVAARLSPAFAEVRFRLGQCFLALTNFEAARQSFVQARDLDALPFRADSTLNRIIAEVARGHAGGGVTYVDANAALAPLNASHIPGEESFYEHVHLSFDGNYRLARAFAEQMLPYLPAAITNRQTSAWAEPKLCAEALGLTGWNRLTVLQEVERRISEAPLANRCDNELCLQRLRAEITRIRAGLDPPAAKAARTTFINALQRRPNDPWLHHSYAEFLTLTGHLPQATAQMRIVRDLLPHNHAAYFQIGRLLALQHEYEPARQALETALRLRPDVAEIYLELGQVAAAQGKLDEALARYAAAQNLHQDDARICLLRARVFEKENKRNQSIQSLREAIELRPSYAEAYDHLGMLLALEGKLPEAQIAFEHLVRLRPDDPEAHLNLGIALARQQELHLALTHFQKAHQLAPDNPKAQEFIQAIERAGGR